LIVWVEGMKRDTDGLGGAQSFSPSSADPPRTLWWMRSVKCAWRRRRR
jgi:hypothetical protein